MCPENGRCNAKRRQIDRPTATKVASSQQQQRKTVWDLSGFILCTDRSQSQTTIITIRLPTLEAAQTSRGGNKERGENITESLCDQMSQFRIAPSFSIEFENINDKQQQKKRIKHIEETDSNSKTSCIGIDRQNVNKRIERSNCSSTIKLTIYHFFYYDWIFFFRAQNINVKIV